MKNKEKLFIVILAMLVQGYTNVEIFTGFYANWPKPLLFLLGIEPITVYRVLIIWYIVFISLSFFFWGEISEKLDGFGKYIIIRNYSKTKFILYQYLSIALNLLGLIVFQFFIYYIMFAVLQKQLDFTVNLLQVGQALWIYFLTFLTLLIFQMVLELYVSSQTALLVTNMYVVFSVLLAGVLFKYQKAQLLLYILLPNFAMVLRTDIRNTEAFTINYFPAVFILILLLTIMAGLSIHRIKTKDFY